MPTTTAAAVIERAASLLQDMKYTRWSREKHLDWLNDAQREAAMLNPSLYVLTIDHPLKPGTKQEIPADGRAWVDVPRNSTGEAITPVARRSLDAQVHDWHSPSRAAKRVLHVCPSPGDAKSFYVYPPSPGGNRVELVYEAIPPVIGMGSLIAIDDCYVGALVDYLMYRAYEKDSEYAPNAAAAALHRSSFVALVKGGGEAPQAATPA